MKLPQNTPTSMVVMNAKQLRTVPFKAGKYHFGNWYIKETNSQ